MDANNRGEHRISEELLRSLIEHLKDTSLPPLRWPVSAEFLPLSSACLSRYGTRLGRQKVSEVRQSGFTHLEQRRRGRIPFAPGGRPLSFRGGTFPPIIQVAENCSDAPSVLLLTKLAQGCIQHKAMSVSPSHDSNTLLDRPHLPPQDRHRSDQVCAYHNKPKSSQRPSVLSSFSPSSRLKHYTIFNARARLTSSDRA
jgi:hypothetical protein